MLGIFDDELLTVAQNYYTSWVLCFYFVGQSTDDDLWEGFDKTIPSVSVEILLRLEVYR